MSVKQMLEHLEAACKDLGVRLMYDDLKGEGGLCRLRDAYILVINRRASAETRVRMMKDALAKVSAAPRPEVQSPKAESMTKAEVGKPETRSTKPELTAEPEVAKPEARTQAAEAAAPPQETPASAEPVEVGAAH